MVGDFEKIVETALQEVVQPLSQLGSDTPYGSPVHSPPHSPPRLMAGINENQPPNPPNPPPSWRARSQLNLAPPLHTYLRILRKCCLILTQVKIFW